MLTPDAHERSGFRNDASPELEATLQRYGKSSQGLIFNKKMRYIETVLEVGDRVYALGSAQVQGGQMVIDRGGGVFLVTDRPEHELIKSFRDRRATQYVIAALLCLAGGSFVLTGLGFVLWRWARGA